MDKIHQTSEVIRCYLGALGDIHVAAERAGYVGREKLGDYVDELLAHGDELVSSIRLLSTMTTFSLFLRVQKALEVTLPNLSAGQLRMQHNEMLVQIDGLTANSNVEDNNNYDSSHDAQYAVARQNLLNRLASTLRLEEPDPSIIRTA